MARTAVCVHCKVPAVRAKGCEVRPGAPNVADKNFWRCPECDAYVMCHRPHHRNKHKAWVPMGHPARKRVRHLRHDLHLTLDPIWRTGPFKGKYDAGRSARRAMYSFLAWNMRLSIRDAHIGFFNEEQCLTAKALLLSATREEFQAMILSGEKPAKWPISRER